jgi:hypothetical protein
MGMTAALVTMAVGAAVSAGVGTYSAIDSNRAAKASGKAAKNATLASAAAEGRAAAKEDALRQDARNAQAKEAQNPELDEAARLSKRKRGVQSTYTAAGGSGAGMMKGTSLTPIGGGDTGAIGAV